jgi:hypothetical protein
MFGASFGPVDISVCAKHRRTFRVRSVAYAHSRKLHRIVQKVKSWTGFADVDTCVMTLHIDAAANYVQKWQVVGAFDHIKELVGFTDSATNLFLSRHLGRLPF